MNKLADEIQDITWAVRYIKSLLVNNYFNELVNIFKDHLGENAIILTLGNIAIIGPIKISWIDNAIRLSCHDTVIIVDTHYANITQNKKGYQIVKELDLKHKIACIVIGKFMKIQSENFYYEGQIDSDRKFHGWGHIKSNTHTFTGFWNKNIWLWGTYESDKIKLSGRFELNKDGTAYLFKEKNKTHIINKLF